MEEQLKRIAFYEGLMEEAEALLRKEARSEADLDRLRELISALEAYYIGDAWLQDYTDDEAGLLPRELKRGVLSQDGLWDLLEAFRELTEEPTEPLLLPGEADKPL